MRSYPFRLLPYHNPQHVDASTIPHGWRFLYAHEFPLPFPCNLPCRLHVVPTNQFTRRQTCTGAVPGITYIIPTTLTLKKRKERSNRAQTRNRVS